jgi:hypothetical protein
MLNLKCFFKPTLVDIAKNELYIAERALLSAKVNKSFCESDIAYNTARIEHLRAAIAEQQPLVLDTARTYGDLSVRTRTGPSHDAGT